MLIPNAWVIVHNIQIEPIRNISVKTKYAIKIIAINIRNSSIVNLLKSNEIRTVVNHKIDSIGNGIP
ncbi:MAG: hypothetical protein QXL33_00025 [Sulfolobaceae archaeon]